MRVGGVLAQRKPFLLRLQPELMDALNLWARDELRSLNAQIEDLRRNAAIEERKEWETRIADHVQTGRHREAYALVVIGRRDVRSNNSWLHNSQRLVKGRPRCTLMIHPDDAARLGIPDGGRARLSSAAAAATVTVRADHRTPPGQLHLPLDPADPQLAAFVRGAERPAGWPLACVLLTGLAPATE